MILRLATVNDLTELFEAGFATFADSALKAYLDYGVNIDNEKIKDVVKQAVENNSVYVGMKEGKIAGAIIGTKSEFPFSKDIIYASYFFFITEEHRSSSAEFLDLLEIALKDAGVDIVIIANPELNKGYILDRFYPIQGYTKLESHYLKRLKNV